MLEKSELEAACHLARDQLETVKRARDQEVSEMREELKVARERAQVSNDRERQSKEEVEEKV
jgi:hypothetical protein